MPKHPHPLPSNTTKRVFLSSGNEWFLKLSPFIPPHISMGVSLLNGDEWFLKLPPHLLMGVSLPDGDDWFLKLSPSPLTYQWECPCLMEMSHFKTPPSPPSFISGNVLAWWRWGAHHGPAQSGQCDQPEWSPGGSSWWCLPPPGNGRTLELVLHTVPGWPGLLEMVCSPLLCTPVDGPDTYPDANDKKKKRDGNLRSRRTLGTE